MASQDLGNFRRIYDKKTLTNELMKETPMEMFQLWFNEALSDIESAEINAMTISTNGKDGFPRGRIVLLKKYTWEGFIFYTNYQSEKGLAIEENSKVCLSFFWEKLERQVIIKGIADKLAPNLSDGYFEQRPRGSQLGAWASDQSQVVERREVLEERLRAMEECYKDKEIPRPPHWGGYLVRPIEVEFWQGRPNRLHDRFRYTLMEDYCWKIERLSP